MQINFSGFFNELFSNTTLKVLAYVWMRKERFTNSSELVPSLPFVPVWAPWKQTGHVMAGHGEGIGVAVLVCLSSGIAPSAVQVFWLVGFFYLISLHFACNILHFCQTAEGTSPMYNYA